jgi:CheY-like chemotaxis protein
MSPSIVARALVVDDSPTQALELRMRLVRSGFEAAAVHSGAEALARLAQDLPDVVLTDLVMPGMDGLELVEQLRGQFPGLPVIVLTAHGNEDIAARALRQGAAGYVPKQRVEQDLFYVLEGVLAVARAERARQRVFECLTHSETRFVLRNDVTLIPPRLGRLQDNLARLRFCDENGRMRVALALREAILNAIEHGNLEVGSELRERDDDSYYRLADERRRQAPYCDRCVHVTATERQDMVRYVIRDEGPGYDATKVPDPTDPENLERASGRGLLLIRSFVDEVIRNERGNEITLVKHRATSGNGSAG